jgi:Rne/Rng family ribonuclease
MAKAKTLDVLVEEFDGSLMVATLQHGKLDGIEIDPSNEEVRWGSVYMGRVTKIDKALDTAFVDLDGSNEGILNCADVRIVGKNGKITKGGNEPIGKLLKAGQSIAVQAKSGYMPRKPEDDTERFEDKVSKVSMDITLQGRYLIHAPLETKNRVSSRIRDKKLRTQLMTMLESLDGVEGIILRASSAGVQTDILRREAKILNALWGGLQDHLIESNAPGLIMDGPDAMQRTLADLAGRRIDRVEVTTMGHFQEVEEWCEVYAPDLVTKIHPIELKKPVPDLGLFEVRDVVGQVEDLFQPYVIMNEAAVMIIEQTAALTAIDVNRGGDTRSNLAINIAAAQEAARQLRLRNLGGIIVIDFLKMKDKTEKEKLTVALGEAFNLDPCTVQIHGLTKLGLMEITRNRRTPPLQEKFESMME